MLYGWHADHPEVRCFEVAALDIPHSEHPDGHRTWNREKYARMAQMRNRLLDRACSYGPDRYLSLDSDIVLQDPATIRTLFDLTGHMDAVSPLTFMTPEGTRFPNVMTWHPATGPGTRALRLGPYPLGDLFSADIIMAVVMMNRSVYEGARYAPHHQGEDLGWAFHCHQLGFALFCASNIYASHVMHPSHLERYLTVGDLRGVADPGSLEAATAGAVVVGSTDT